MESPTEKYIARIPCNRIDRTIDTKISQQTCFQIEYWNAHKPMQITRLSIPIIKNIVTTLYLQPRGHVYAFYFLLQFYNILRKEHIKFGSFAELIRKKSHSDKIYLLDSIKKSSRFCNLWKLKLIWCKEILIICKFHIFV